jgi:tetratricopeptide (TPR) repeat protein
MWYLLATTLKRTSGFAAPGEIESALQRSVSFNPSLLPATDSLAMLLVDGRRYQEADDLMARMLPRLSDPSLARGRQAWIHRKAGRKAEALDELIAALRDAPWFLWAWALVLAWLIEDKAWDKARSLLCPSPPEVRTDISVRSKRLSVLEQAGLPVVEIDAEWNALLKDFPEDMPLHLERYDGLRDSKRTAEAVALLEPLSSGAPGNPWMLARLVEVRAGQRKKSEAIATLLEIWFGEGEGFDWAARYGWNAVERASAGIECCQKARHRLEQGSRPNPEAFSIMVTHATRHEITNKNRRPAWRALFPGAGARDALALLDLVRKAGGRGGDYEAAVLTSLSNCGYERLVVRMWKKGRTLAATEVQSWAEVGRALTNLDRKKDGRRLLGGWRQRAGVKMWMVTNYIQCVSTWRRKDWQEIRSVCRDSLASLHHDHCAKYLAHLQAEMSACLGDTDAFRQTWLNQRTYFTGNLEDSEWFAPQRKYLLTAIPNGGRLLEQNQPKLFKKACRNLRNRRWGLVGSPGSGTRFRGLPWWAWIILFLALQLMRLLDQH